ncbi:MAG: calcium/sodium antiporter [Tidjanibacter sp.]|nr:calcium/sodium antiporter [Tidjanibacter sp.]
MTYVILIIALLAIIYGANWFVDGAVGVARKLKISDFVIGAVIVGVGTSLPELIVSLKGAVDGNSNVAIGNVVGSNIFNVLAILGLTAVISPVVITKENRRKDLPLCLGVSVLLTLMAYNFFVGEGRGLERWDGLILLAIFGWFLYTSLKEGKNAPQEEVAVEDKEAPLWKSLVMIAVGLTVLILGCTNFVDSAIEIAKQLGVSDAFISITLIACGTSLPELAASLAAAAKKNTQLALGNIVGSNIFNITLILGTSSQVLTLHSPNINLVDYGVATLAVALTMLLGAKGKLSRVGGAILFACFVAYNIYLFKTQVG